MNDDFLMHKLSVSELNEMVKSLLEEAIGMIWIEGEISNFSQPNSGHWYFTLKDEKAQIRCVMFRHKNFHVNFVPKFGQKIVIKANLTLYETRGEFQLIAEKMIDFGEGELKFRFELLKKKLFEQGLFDTKFKQSLPKFPKSVGLITSKTGAAIHDILTVLKRRDPSLLILIYPTLVQGENAAESIKNRIELANIHQKCDVIILARGGGSLEDLWAFNEEIVARAIFNSRIPIISAIGHEIDFTIADFVADFRAATPSAAAEIISQNQEEKMNQLRFLQKQIETTFVQNLHKKSIKLNEKLFQLKQLHPKIKLEKNVFLFKILIQKLEKNVEKQFKMKQTLFKKWQLLLIKKNPIQTCLIAQNKINLINEKLQKLMQENFQKNNQNLMLNATKLNEMNPVAILTRGYSVSMNSKKEIIKSVTQINKNEILITQLNDGWIESEIKTISLKK